MHIYPIGRSVAVVKLKVNGKTISIVKTQESSPVCKITILHC